MDSVVTNTSAHEGFHRPCSCTETDCRTRNQDARRGMLGLMIPVARSRAPLVVGLVSLSSAGLASRLETQAGLSSRLNSFSSRRHPVCS